MRGNSSWCHIMHFRPLESCPLTSQRPLKLNCLISQFKTILKTVFHPSPTYHHKVTSLLEAFWIKNVGLHDIPRLFPHKANWLLHHSRTGKHNQSFVLLRWHQLRFKTVATNLARAQRHGRGAHHAKYTGLPRQVIQRSDIKLAFLQLLWWNEPCHVTALWTELHKNLVS